MHLAAYQFVIDRYFEIINEQRKLQKQEAVQQSETVLLNYLEQELYSWNKVKKLEKSEKK